MRTIIRRILVGLGILIGVLLIAVVALVVYGSMTFKRTHADRPLQPIVADTSPEGLARGEYLLTSVMLCNEACHSPKGKPFNGVAEPIAFGPIRGTFSVPNLTPDQETGLGGWTDAQIARAIREGLDKDGVELVIMPSNQYHVLSDADVAAIIGYLRSLQPVRNQLPPFQVNAIGKVMSVLGMMGPKSLTEPITGPRPAPQPGTAEYGAYLVSIADCRTCHGENLAGGPTPFAEPGAVPAANLTPGGELVGWSEADFIKAVTTGVKPSGKALDEGMPRYRMTDDDLKAVFAYLKTVPAAQPKE